jgi:hypothetical protein
MDRGVLVAKLLLRRRLGFLEQSALDGLDADAIEARLGVGRVSD